MWIGNVNLTLKLVFSTFFGSKLNFNIFYEIFLWNFFINKFKKFSHAP